MEAVELDTDFELRWNDKVYETIRARDLWDKIIAAAHSSAEPGIIFWGYAFQGRNPRKAPAVMEASIITDHCVISAENLKERRAIVIAETTATPGS